MNIEYLDVDGNPIYKLTQWDVNRKLKITGLTLTVAPMIHFYNDDTSRALVVPATITEGNIYVDVPNKLLQYDKPMKVAIFEQDSANAEGRTLHITTLQVEPKKKPEDYNYVENIEYANWVEKANQADIKLQDMQDIIDDVQAKLDNGDFNGPIGPTGAEGPQGPAGPAGPAGADGNVSFGELTPAQKAELKGEQGEPGIQGPEGPTGPEGKTPTIGDNGNWFIGDVDTTKPSRGIQGLPGIQGEQGEQGYTPTIGTNGNWFINNVDTQKPSRGIQGEQGQAGTNGTNGNDGFTPIVNATKVGKTTTITITNKTGETSTEIKDGLDGTNGTTPVKGVDYWTDSDKQSIVTDVLNSLQNAEGGNF